MFTIRGIFEVPKFVTAVPVIPFTICDNIICGFSQNLPVKPPSGPRMKNEEEVGRKKKRNTEWCRIRNRDEQTQSIDLL